MAKVTGELGRHEEPEKIKVIDMPFTPGYPTNLSLSLYIVLGLIGGIGCGIGLTVAAELLDDTLWHIRNFNAFDNINILARLPSIDYEKDSENENNG